MARNSKYRDAMLQSLQDHLNVIESDVHDILKLLDDVPYGYGSDTIDEVKTMLKELADRLY